MSTKMATALRAGDDTTNTATDVVREAMRKLGRQPSLAIVYCSPKYDYKKVVSVVRAETNGAPLIGCSSAGEFTESAVASHSIALGLIWSDSHEYYTAWAGDLMNDPDACLEAAVGKLPDVSGGHRSFLLYHDGLVGRGEEAVLSAASKLGAGARFCGGSAGDDLGFKESYVFCDDVVVRDAAALCLCVSRDQPPSVSVKHGHVPLSPPMTATRTAGSILYEVDNRPAWEVWREHTRAAARAVGIDVDHLDNPSDIGSFLIRYELGLLVGKDYKVRVPLSKNPDGSLNFACTIYQGSKFRIMESFKDRQIESAGIAAERAAAEVPKDKRAGALVFDCVCRGIILGDEFKRGIEAIKDKVGAVPLLGFETYGEICMREGEFSGYHNTTTVVSIIPD